MQKPFAGLLSDVLWYVHALDPIGVQKSDTTSNLQTIKNPEDANLQGIWCYGGVDGTRTRDPRRDRPVF